MDTLLRGLTRAAVFLSRADGTMQEREVEALIDAVRIIAMRTGDQLRLESWSTVAVVVDEARLARVGLRTMPEETYLTETASLLDGRHTEDALALALTIAEADGVLTEGERGAFRRLAQALGATAEQAERILTAVEARPPSR